MIETFREINAVLAGLTFFGLCYRLPPAMRTVQSRRIFLALAAFPVLAGLGSVQALIQHYPPGPVAPMFTVAYVALGAGLVWWPSTLTGTKGHHTHD